MTALDLRDAVRDDDGLVGVAEGFTAADTYGAANLWLKHGFDRGLGAALLVALSPVLLACAAAVVAEGRLRPGARGPVFVTQTRYSAGRPFALVKFRSFYPGDDPLCAPLHDTTWFINERRQTRVGRILRRFYLDEVPQLFNIAKGEMSFVGPRPWPKRQYEDSLRKGYHARRLLRGGVCGPRQAAKGRPHRFRHKLDMEEVLARNYLARSALGVLWLDLRIIARTLRVVGRAEGL